jgi:hypothetical protein
LLDYHEYLLAKVADKARALERCPEFDQLLSRPSTDPGAEALRPKLLLQFRIGAERLGYSELELGAFAPLYDAVPDNERNDEFWHFVSSWAFTHHHHGILEQAYEEYSINKGSFMAEWLWWRVRLMYRLSAGQATPEDVRQLLASLALRNHLADFESRLLPALKHAGLWDPVLMEQLEVRRVAIEGKSVEEIKREVAET